MFNEAEIKKIREYYDLAIEDIEKNHIIKFKNHDNYLLLVSEKYCGAWLEHACDSVMLACFDEKYIPLAYSTLNDFMTHQSENGHIPCYMIDRNKNQELPEYSYTQVQECVSFTMLCNKYFELTNDIEFLKQAYEVCKKWVKWFENYRKVPNKELIYCFSGYDTGHDDSGRFLGVKYNEECKNNDSELCPDDDNILPMIAIDMNSDYYGNLKNLEKMAEILENKEDADYYNKKSNQFLIDFKEICYDEEDDFYYDVDKNGNKIKVKSISICNLFLEKVLSFDDAKRIFEKHLLNPEEFFTKAPFPAVAVNDKTWVKNLPGNSWGYYTQANTISRLYFWMDYYNFSETYDYILENWIRLWTFENEMMFGQELDPKTGKASISSPWYMPCLIAYTYGVKRLNLL